MKATDQPILTPTPRTEPLGPDALAALARLERAFLPPAVARAVTVYETATARYDELAARPASTLSGAEFDSLTLAQSRLAEAFGVLAETNRLDLIAPAETASRYRTAATHYKTLAAGGDYEGCEYIHDEMAMCACQLADAGRLDLIGAGV